MSNRSDGDLKYASITQSIIGCSFDVINELGSGFLESVYQNALVYALREKGFTCNAQAPVIVSFRGQSVGSFFVDILVENKVLIELKAVKTLLPEHQAQVINYLNATGIEVGLLINFGKQKLEYRRLTRNKNWIPGKSAVDDHDSSDII